MGIIDTAAQELPSIMMRKGVAVYFHWGWCEVEAVIQSYAQTVGQRRVLEHMCKFLVHLGKSWAAARKAGQQQTFPVQDVVGQSVAILQVPDLLQSRIYAVTTCMAAARAAGSADFCINFRLVILSRMKEQLDFLRDNFEIQSIDPSTSCPCELFANRCPGSSVSCHGCIEDERSFIFLYWGWSSHRLETS